LEHSRKSGLIFNAAILLPVLLVVYMYYDPNIRICYRWKRGWTHSTLTYPHCRLEDPRLSAKTQVFNKGTLSRDGIILF
jgi:hypothetical protein